MIKFKRNRLFNIMLAIIMISVLTSTIAPVIVAAANCPTFEKEDEVAVLPEPLIISDLASTVVTVSATVANWPTLKSGSKGSEVTALQELLVYNGYSPGTIDGDFGTNTTNAVKAFQKKNGLTADGIVGPKTFEKLITTVKTGSNSRAVRAVQYLLRDKFGIDLSIDGVFGTSTLSGVNSFQKAHTLSIDGVVGKDTWKTLFGAAAKKINLPVPTPPSTDNMVLAKKILNDSRITLAKVHPSGVDDGAQPYYQIKDTANGKAAKRSSYGNAPGGTVKLSANSLRAILLLADKFGSIKISEIAGASHSVNSWHYQKTSSQNALDITALGGAITSAKASQAKAFLQAQGFVFSSDPAWEGSHIHLAFK
ncbi:hypothetical protein FACS1894219_04820 [Clostridia bacterium]|nr:hypothetical protein FACS1894219_04820 [Clostridia bacterium]